MLGGSPSGLEQQPLAAAAPEPEPTEDVPRVGGGSPLGCEDDIEYRGGPWDTIHRSSNKNTRFAY